MEVRAALSSWYPTGRRATAGIQVGAPPGWLACRLAAQIGGFHKGQFLQGGVIYIIRGGFVAFLDRG